MAARRWGYLASLLGCWIFYIAYGEWFSWVALLLIVPVTIPLIQNLGIDIQRAKNKHRARSIVCGCLAVGNVCISIFLIPRFGAIGAAAGTALALLLGNVLFMNWYYHRRLQLNMACFWKEILGVIPAVGGVFAAGMVLKNGCAVNSWGQLIFAGSLYTAGYCAVFWHFVLKPGEKQAVKEMLRKKE
jgi:O-antigen/teichoic acid export membrane protein